MTAMMEVLAVGRTAPGSATWAHCGLPAARLPVMSSLAESVGLAETARQITTVAVRGAAARLQARASVGRCSTAGRRAWSTAPLRLTPAAAGPAGVAGRAQVIVTAAQGGRGGNGGSGFGGVDGTCNLINCTVASNRGNGGPGGTGGAAGTGQYPGAPGPNGMSGTAWGGTACGPLVNTLIASNTPAGGDSFPDPKLGPLADNGGPTLTMALLPGSPAIDAGNTSLAPATDQRGFPRPAGLAADLGAFEYGSV